MKEITVSSIWHIAWMIVLIAILVYIYKYPPKIKLQVDLGGSQ